VPASRPARLHRVYGAVMFNEHRRGRSSRCPVGPTDLRVVGQLTRLTCASMLVLAASFACGTAEMNDVRAALRKVPGATLVGWNGNERIFETGHVRAGLRFPDGTTIAFVNLGLGSFRDPPELWIERVNNVWPRTQKCSRFAGVSGGSIRPIKEFGVNLKSGPLARKLHGPVINVEDAARRHLEIEELFAHMPVCPAYGDIRDDDGTVLRYCAEQGNWVPAPPPTCN
jgi:hypothetical protein